MSRVKRTFQTLWNYLREVSGENDYAHYVKHALESGQQPLSRQAFYLRQLEHRHSKPNRCC